MGPRPDGIPVKLAVFLSMISGIVCRDLTLEPGHLKPFGEGRPSQPVPEIEGFPNPEEFFTKNVRPLRPIKMNRAAMMFPAFEKWTDDYFLSSDEPENHRVAVETKKKEDRNQNMLDMSFKGFVGIYNKTTYYMVNAVPKFISHDVVVPCPLQCNFITEKSLADNVMWFSSGGTNSVVHTDSFDNINCLLRGNKTLVMVDPGLYKDKVDIDHPEGSYSEVNVDSVDYLKYPGLADVEFFHVNLTAGDCLYIPYKWIHQVRSFGSNLAVNVWWHHYLKDDVKFDDCNTECDPMFTLDRVNFKNSDGSGMSPEEVRDHFMSLVSISKPLDFPRFIGKLLAGYTSEDLDRNPALKTGMSQIFSLVDLDKDGVLTQDEMKETSDEMYEEVWKVMEYLENAMGEDDSEQDEDVDEPDESEHAERYNEDDLGDAETSDIDETNLNNDKQGFNHDEF